MLPIKFNLSVGDIPEGAIGFLQGNTDGTVNYSRCFILRKYVGLDDKVLPCYDMAINNEKYVYWSEIKDLEESLKKELLELEDEINKKEKLYIGPGGILVRTLGIDLDGKR